MFYYCYYYRYYYAIGMILLCVYYAVISIIVLSLVSYHLLLLLLLLLLYPRGVRVRLGRAAEGAPAQAALSLVLSVLLVQGTVELLFVEGFVQKKRKNEHKFTQRYH